jgi:hypothetical protein
MCADVRQFTLHWGSTTKRYIAAAVTVVGFLLFYCAERGQ